MQLSHCCLQVKALCIASVTKRTSSVEGKSLQKPIIAHPGSIKLNHFPQSQERVLTKSSQPLPKKYSDSPKGPTLTCNPNILTAAAASPQKPHVLIGYRSGTGKSHNCWLSIVFGGGEREGWFWCYPQTKPQHQASGSSSPRLFIALDWPQQYPVGRKEFDELMLPGGNCADKPVWFFLNFQRCFKK